MWIKQSVTLLLLLVSVLGTLPAQPDPKGSKQMAEKYFSAGKYLEALQNYLIYQTYDPSDLETRFRVGVCYYETGKLQDARRNFSSLAEGEKYANPQLSYYLGLCSHSSFQFQDAIRYYKEYLRRIENNHPRRAMVKDMIRRCAFGIRIQLTKTPVFVENPGPNVNSAGNDFRPIPSRNQEGKLYFSSSREGNAGGPRNAAGEPSGIEGKFNSDMFSTTFTGNQWSKPVPLSFLMNGAKNDVLLDFNKDGTLLYYFQGLDLFSGDVFVDTFRLRPEERSLFPPEFKGPLRPEAGDGDLYFFQDTILLFSSQRDGGYGGYDIYLTQFSNGYWSEPLNLGPKVNTAYDERSPFLAVDGRTLYVSTNNPMRSLGGFDVIRFFYDDASESWLDPWNPGTALNSAGDDLHFRLSEDGLNAFFSSNRMDGAGQSDIYIARFRESQREQTRLMNPIVFSQVRDFKLQFARRMGMVDDPSAYFPEDQIEKYFLDPLYYEENGEIMTGRNLRTLGIIAGLMVRYPQIRIILTSHSDGTDPDNVDLFFAAKRADAVIDYLARNGVGPDRIIARSVGKSYPKANSMMDKTTPNPSGRQINRRIDFSFLYTSGLPLRIRIKAPEVPEQMVNKAWDFYTKSIEGLSYKLQIASTPQMNSNDMLLRYPNPMIEKEPGTNNYLYTVGLYKTFKSASLLQQDLIRNGAEDTRVIPYVDGIRLEESQVASLAKDYPDLENFLQR